MLKKNASHRFRQNTAIPQLEIKISEILQEKLSNTVILQTPISPSEINDLLSLEAVL